MANNKKAWVMAGAMTQPEENMCQICFKPAMWEGRTWHLCDYGIRQQGTVIGCLDCDVWTWFDLNGNAYVPEKMVEG